MATPLKVLFITYYWPPSGGAGVQRCLKFVKNLPALGIEPTVVTVACEEASYPVLDYSLERDIPAGVRVIRTSTTEPFELYRKLTSKKEIPYSGFANESKPGKMQQLLRFVRGNFFIPDARVGWNRHALKACRELLAKEKFDVIFTSSPPHSTQLIGLKLKQEFPEVKWIADLRDPWTDIFYNKEMAQTALAKKLDRHYERQVLTTADIVLVTSPDTRNLFLQKAYGISDPFVKVITNGYDAEDFTFPSTPPQHQLCITYTGTITEAYNLTGFYQALAEVIKERPEVPIKLKLVGKISHGVQLQLEQAGLLPITEAMPYVPHSESVKLLMQSTVLLLAFAEASALLANIPGKLFEYLASGKPILAIGAKGSSTEAILQKCQAGELFAYTDKTGIKTHLHKLCDQWLQNPNLDLPHQLYQRYSRENLTKELAELLRDLAGRES